MAVLRTPEPSLSVAPSEAKGVGEYRVSRRDDEILEAVRRGDAVVAADFYWRIKPIVDRTIRRLIGRLDRDGEDLIQIALVQLIESLPTYRGECPLDAWVSAVAANVVYKHIRRRRLERNIFESALENDDELSTSQNTPSIAQRILLRDAVKHVVTHLTTMRSHRAWAFLLHDVCGYSLDEVAHICSVSVVAAQSRLVRGRRDLHQLIVNDPRLAGCPERALSPVPPATERATASVRRAPVHASSVKSEPGESKSPSTLATENDLFSSALKAGREGERREAVELLDVLLARFPNSPLKQSAESARATLSQSIPAAR